MYAFAEGGYDSVYSMEKDMETILNEKNPCEMGTDSTCISGVINKLSVCIETGSAHGRICRKPTISVS